MAELDTLDAVVLGVILVGTVAYLTKGSLWGIPKDPYASAFATTNVAKPGRTRNFIEKMEESGKNCIIFYGSQTGTAEDYASRLAKEGKSRFGLETMIADLEEYDFDNLDTFPSDKIAFFVLATYGEGEPTDNAVEFHEFFTADEVSFSEGNDDKPLQNLNYVGFGLGNNTYEQYNAMIRKVDKALTKYGAHRIGPAGEGDDGAGTMEEDFLAWKELMWPALAKAMNLEEREAVYEPIFGIIERPGLTWESPEVYLGEPNKMHLEGVPRGPFNAHNPYIAPLSDTHELFTGGSRNCVFAEFDISGSTLSYTTGDHIALWPTNAGDEVDRFLDIIGLTEKRHQVISVKALEPTAKVPFPTPTTYDTIARYHLEIGAPVSRQFVSTLAAFAPNEEAKAEMTKLGSDKDYFLEKTGPHFYNIARFLSSVSKGAKWEQAPFFAFMEGLNKLQPRYYSISSSSLVNPKKIAVTAVIEADEVPSREDPFRGVASHYLFALKQKQNGDQNPSPYGLSYALNGPRSKYNGVHIPVHVRHSNFRMPSDPAKPIIMVGPGTGVAPFRAFVQERVKLLKEGVNVGRSILFFGCRRRTEDFLYEQEWKEYKDVLGDKFELVTAFSRETPQKVYVQHRLKERSKDVNELLAQRAYFYVCGDATRMARDVNNALVQIIAEGRDVSEQKGEEIVKSMRAANQYQEDIWS